jgi:hypothetical protein
MVEHTDESMMQAIILIRECRLLGLELEAVLDAIGIPLGSREPPETGLRIVSTGHTGRGLQARIWAAVDKLSDTLLTTKKSRYTSKLKSQLAYLMLERCRFISGPPPDALCKLIRMSLGVSGYVGREVRNPSGRLRAIAVLAKAPNSTARQLEKAARIGISTANRWLRDSATIQADIEVYKELLSQKF